MRDLGTLAIISLVWLYAAEATRTRLTWVNGIGYSLEHMEHGKKEISKLFGGKKVEYCHNPTAMTHEDDLVGYIGDLSQAGTQKFGRITEEVNSLVKHLKDAVASVGKRGKVIHIAHSQGALVTFLASRQLTPLEMSQIEVIAFGGAAALQKTPSTPFSRCANYYAANDPLLLLVPTAAQALRSGFVANEEFCFLAPRVGDPIADHNLLGLTYGQALAWEGQRFQRKYQSLISRSSRSLLIWTIGLSGGLEAKMTLLLKTLLRPLLLLWLFLGRDIFQPAWNLVKSKILPPIFLVGAVIVDWVFVTLRSLMGNENYVPADSIINQQRKSAQKI